VEGLFLVVLQSIKSADLVRVRVFFCIPGSAVPELAVAGISRSEIVACMLHEQLCGVIELNRRTAVPPVGLAECLGAEIAVAEGCGLVVNRLVVRGVSD